MSEPNTDTTTDAGCTESDSPEPINMDDLVVIGSTEHSKDELLRLLETLLPENVFETLRVNPTYQHPDWEQGDCCPECGGKKISEMQAAETIFHSEYGEYGFAGHGEAFGHVTSQVCVNCMTTLTRTATPEF